MSIASNESQKKANKSSSSILFDPCPKNQTIKQTSIVLYLWQRKLQFMLFVPVYGSMLFSQAPHGLGILTQKGFIQIPNVGRGIKNPNLSNTQAVTQQEKPHKTSQRTPPLPRPQPVSNKITAAVAISVAVTSTFKIHK